MTVKEMLIQKIDIRTKKVNARKILQQAINKAEPAVSELIETILQDSERQFTVLELAEKIVAAEAEQMIQLPSFLLEDSDFTKIKKRYYSVVNDPFNKIIYP